MINFLKKFYKWIIGIFLIAGASAAFVGGLPSDTIYDLPPISISNPTSKSDFQNMSFKKFVKNTTVFQFQERTTKKIFELEVSQATYDDFFKTHIKPTYSNADFIGASYKVIYATSTPIIIK